MAALVVVASADYEQAELVCTNSGTSKGVLNAFFTVCTVVKS